MLEKDNRFCWDHKFSFFVENLFPIPINIVQMDIVNISRRKWKAKTVYRYCFIIHQIVNVPVYIVYINEIDKKAWVRGAFSKA